MLRFHQVNKRKIRRISTLKLAELLPVRGIKSKYHMCLSMNRFERAYIIP